MTNIFTKQIYVKKVNLTFGLKSTTSKLEKANGLKVLVISVCVYYFLTEN